jgi:hypothetical protein
MTETYKIVRCFFNQNKKRLTMATGLTLKEAQAHCSDPETSSKGKSARARAITQHNGPWFDAYYPE